MEHPHVQKQLNIQFAFRCMIYIYIPTPLDVYLNLYIYIYICAVDLRSSYMRSAEGMLGPESRFDQRCRLFFQDYTPYHPLGLEYLPTFKVDVYGFHARKYTIVPWIL